MRIMVGPNQWRDEGPQPARSTTMPTGYQLHESPLPTLESVENAEEAAILQVGKRRVQSTGKKGYMWRKVREIQ